MRKNKARGLGLVKRYDDGGGVWDNVKKWAGDTFHIGNDAQSSSGPLLTPSPLPPEKPPEPVPEPVVDQQPAVNSSDLFFNKMLGIESTTGQFDKKGKTVVSNRGAIGASQLRPDSAKEAAKELGVPFDKKRLSTDPDYNISLGRAYYGKLVARFGGDHILAAAAYNHGPTNISRIFRESQKNGTSWKDKLPKETRNYISKLQMESAGGPVHGLGLVKRK